MGGFYAANRKQLEFEVERIKEAFEGYGYKERGHNPPLAIQAPNQKEEKFVQLVLNTENDLV